MNSRGADRGSTAADLRLLVAAARAQAPRQVTLQAVLLLVSGVVGGVSLLLLIPIVNSIADTGDALTGSIFSAINLTSVALPALLALFVIFAAGQALIMRTSAINSSKLQQELIDSMRNDAFAALLAARWTFITQRQGSDVVNIVTVGASRAGLAFNQLLRGSVTTVLLVATAAVALVVSPIVAATAIAGIALLGLAQATAIKPAHRLGTLLGARNRHVQATVTATMDSLRSCAPTTQAGCGKTS